MSSACIQHAFSPFIQIILLLQMGMHHFRTETSAERKIQSYGMGYAAADLILRANEFQRSAILHLQLYHLYQIAVVPSH